MGIFRTIGEKYFGVERRGSPRNTVVHSAWVYLGGNVLPLICVLWDISDTGARLVIPSPEALPDYFYLLMSREERPGRRCKVVWRKGSNVGLSFVPQATLSPLRDAQS